MLSFQKHNIRNESTTSSILGHQFTKLAGFVEIFISDIFCMSSSINTIVYVLRNYSSIGYTLQIPPMPTLAL